MIENQEIIADIVAWLRRPREGENAYLTLWRGEIADRIEAAEKHSVTNCNRFGNAAKMREAIDKCVNLITEFGDAEIIKKLLYVILDIEAILKADLAEPPRNCDVGTYEEQSERFTRFCASQDCKRTCPFSDDYDSYRCEFAWAQMPYEEGGAK